MGMYLHTANRLEALDEAIEAIRRQHRQYAMYRNEPETPLGQIALATATGLSIALAYLEALPADSKGETETMATATTTWLQLDNGGINLSNVTTWEWVPRWPLGYTEEEAREEGVLTRVIVVYFIGGTSTELKQEESAAFAAVIAWQASKPETALA